ncbi:hypothetical protein N8865_00370 [Francisellaceae bacterium]|nr:hypothetical protein [Francisellaceae bacterium]
MLILNILAIIFAIISIIGIITFIKACFKVKVMQAGSLFISTSIFTLLAVSLFLIVFNLKTYFALTHEQTIGTISFVKIKPQHYQANLSLSNGKAYSYLIDGDQWMLSSQVLKWKPIANFIGLHTLYRLDRISGRYNDLDQAIHGKRTVYDLQSSQKLDLWTLTKNAPKWGNWLVDAEYGNAVFMPMGNHLKYQISLGQDGLISREI